MHGCMRWHPHLSLVSEMFCHLHVTFDACNEVIALALAIANVENSDDWVLFKENSEANFPGFIVWMPDANEGIKSNAFALSGLQSLEGFDLG